MPGRSALVESARSSVDALVAEPREAGEVGAAAVDRRVVELEVAGVHDRALVGVQGDGDGVRDRVGDAG